MKAYETYIVVCVTVASLPCSLTLPG